MAFCKLGISRFTYAANFQILACVIICFELQDTIIKDTPARATSGTVEYFFAGTIFLSTLESCAFTKVLSSGMILRPRYRLIFGVGIIFASIALITRTINLDQSEVPRCQTGTNTVPLIAEARSRGKETQVILSDQPPCQEFTIKLIFASTGFVIGICYIVFGMRTLNGPEPERRITAQLDLTNINTPHDTTILIANERLRCDNWCCGCYFNSSRTETQTL